MALNSVILTIGSWVIFIWGLSLTLPFGGSHRDQRALQWAREADMAASALLQMQREVDLRARETWADAAGSRERWQLSRETARLAGETARTFRQEYGAFFSGAVALSLNAGAYISEIFRAGIESIHRGQTQAAWSLGLTHGQAMRFVILPQAFRRMVPALVNEGVTLIKDSSLVSAIGLAELALAARTVAGAYSRYWEPYLAISLIYLILTLALSAFAKRLEAPAHLRGR